MLISSPSSHFSICFFAYIPKFASNHLGTLDASIEVEKERNEFLEGVPDSLGSCSVYDPCFSSPIREWTKHMINDLWYKNAIIYCLSVSTFMDADGDGIGDFPGLMNRLDYLQGIGVTAIWLMPFQPSPFRDDGYDVADYYGVDPRYGTLGDFVEFTHGCKQRGIRVLIDLVVNHTSDKHPWFQKARSDPKSKYRDWYVWSKKKPKHASDGVVFPGVQKSTWNYDKLAKAWYFHRFYDFQPDLNTSNPRVQAEILKIMGFWIQLGVSGFRMDAVPFIIGTKGAAVRVPTEQYDMLRTFREFLSWRQGDAIILAEANVLPKTDMEYFGASGERMQMMFNFDVNQHMFHALATSDARPLVKALKATKISEATAQWGQFLRNHDELDLGRLTHDQRQAVSPSSLLTKTCSFTTVAFAADLLPCCKVIAAAWSWPTV